ncbi:hypothetical protein [Paraburkholderia megapolitana]|uniref:hypothetical protein n=1 Tax=Paraburkholderia megapolitana TaxID=420953 RepID=UPI0014793F85|nr:hypothetical protein [Paraburkholderia megapolitana]
MNKYAAVALCALGATDFIFPNIAMAAQSTGIEVAVPAYVFPGDPFLTTMEDPVKMPVPPSIVIVNIANGDADESILDHDADLLRARVAASREPRTRQGDRLRAYDSRRPVRRGCRSQYRPVSRAA